MKNSKKMKKAAPAKVTKAKAQGYKLSTRESIMICVALAAAIFCMSLIVLQ